MSVELEVLVKLKLDVSSNDMIGNIIQKVEKQFGVPAKNMKIKLKGQVIHPIKNKDMYKKKIPKNVITNSNLYNYGPINTGNVPTFNSGNSKGFNTGNVPTFGGGNSTGFGGFNVGNSTSSSSYFNDGPIKYNF